MSIAENPIPGSYWAATQMLPRREYFLRHFGYEVYLPRERQYRLRWRRRTEDLAPLFPGYCSVRVALQWTDIKNCPGVILVVRHPRGADRRRRAGACGRCGDRHPATRRRSRSAVQAQSRTAQGRQGADRHRPVRRLLRALHASQAQARRRTATPVQGGPAGAGEPRGGRAGVTPRFTEGDHQKPATRGRHRGRERRLPQLSGGLGPVAAAAMGPHGLAMKAL